MVHLHGSETYIDDIIRHSMEWDDHLKKTHAFSERRSLATSAENLSKCAFAQANVVFLGLVVSQGQEQQVNAIFYFKRLYL